MDLLSVDKLENEYENEELKNEGIIRIDPVDLIAEVKKHSCLYQLDDEDYRDRAKKHKTWLLVASTLVAGYADMTNKQKNLIVKAFAKRWKTLRDAFVRYTRMSHTGVKVNKRYIYSRQMAFLLDGGTLMHREVVTQRSPRRRRRPPATVDTSVAEPLPKPSSPVTCPVEINEPITDRVPAICKVWAESLITLEAKQRIFAEKAISDILFAARLGELTRDVVRRYEFVSEVVPSPEHSDLAIDFE